MPRYAKMLHDGMKSRGHEVQLWHPRSFFSKFSTHVTFKKWLGYIDQYIVFTSQVKQRLKKTSPATLYVFTDQALGPWVPIVKNLPHVIHCHDFLAQRSALGEIPENRVGWTGKKYQSYIKRGYMQGRNFISVSEKTRHDLHKFLLPTLPEKSELVYNGLNQEFTNINQYDARRWLSKTTGLSLDDGFLLHVGGNQFYKNRIGVIEIYDQWRKFSSKKYPLILIGESPDFILLTRYKNSDFKESIYFLPNKDDKFVRTAYAGASVLIYPSIAEGFGWPIAEAMASGCPVLTTNEPPMSEVAGEAGFLIPVKPVSHIESVHWSYNGAKTLEEILNLTPDMREDLIEKGISNANRFNPQKALDQIEEIYKSIIADSKYTKQNQTNGSMSKDRS